MDYRQLLDGMERFGSNEDDICIHGLGVSSNLINSNVIIAPWWEPQTLVALGNAQYLSESEISPVKVWNIINDNLRFTYIKTVLALLS